MFSKSKATSAVESLAQRSSKVVDVFTKTIADFTSINDQARLEISERNNVIQKAETERTQLEGIIVANSKIVNNLNKILE